LLYEVTYVHNSRIDFSTASDQTASDINTAAWSVEQNFAVVEANIGTEPEFAVRLSMKIN